MKIKELANRYNNFKSTSTKLEERVANIICQENFPFNRFIVIAELLIRRQSRRRERIRTDKMINTDFINGFIRSDFPRLTQFQ